jgi:predicted Holliday junction resolvase-like endonuclease
MNNQTIFLLVVIIILLYWVYWQNSQSNLLTLEYKSQNKSLQQKAQNYQDLYQKRAEEKVLLDEKINDLETALFNSGKKNLAKKKETQELLENMESR